MPSSAFLREQLRQEAKANAQAAQAAPTASIDSLLSAAYAPTSSSSGFKREQLRRERAAAPASAKEGLSWQSHYFLPTLSFF